MLPTLLGGLKPRQFLEDYWQKKPLLIRNAIPGFAGLLSRDELINLACSEETESRFINCDDWSLKRGPLSRRDFPPRKGGEKKPWTVLVQGVNLAIDEGERLLREFDFIPYSRLDDLMASYATDGGGVGPHFDNYDVFLLQGMGQRRWRIGTQRDKSLKSGLPLKILENFRPTHEFVLDPGDMLYLPPQYAHDGIAIGECTTWSIGFRAPPYAELGEGFLTYLQDRVALDGRYTDADLALQPHAAEISAAMIDRIAAEMAKIRWNRTTVSDFLGCYLSEPKSSVVFDPPRRPLALGRFITAIAKRGLVLDRRTQLLFTRNQFYINGEPVVVSLPARALVRRLADKREIGPGPSNSSAAELFYQWYCDGFLNLR